MFEGGASPTEVGTLKQPELAASTSFKCIFNSFASTGQGGITKHGTPSRFHDRICKGKRVVYIMYMFRLSQSFGVAQLTVNTSISDKCC